MDYGTVQWINYTYKLGLYIFVISACIPNSIHLKNIAAVIVWKRKDYLKLRRPSYLNGRYFSIHLSLFKLTRIKSFNSSKLFGCDRTETKTTKWYAYQTHLKVSIGLYNAKNGSEIGKKLIIAALN